MSFTLENHRRRSIAANCGYCENVSAGFTQPKLYVFLLSRPPTVCHTVTVTVNFVNVTQISRANRKVTKLTITWDAQQQFSLLLSFGDIFAIGNLAFDGESRGARENYRWIRICSIEIAAMWRSVIFCCLSHTRHVLLIKLLERTLNASESWESEQSSSIVIKRHF